MKGVKYILLVIVGLMIVETSCKHDPQYAIDVNTDTGLVAMTPYTWVNPPHFPYAEIPADNQLYKERIALGKKLYFDTRLSNNGESCNTCHLQNHGFSMPGTSAFDNGLTALPLVNLAWYKNFMWSGRIVGTLEDVMHAEVTKRFNTDIPKINAIAEYRTMFKQYYGVDNITPQDLSKALAQYMRVLVSRDTKYEKNFLGVQPLTKNEQAGRDIFFSEKGDCFHCHVAILTSDNMMHNNGLDSLYAKTIDKGFYNVTGDPKDLGKFRTPNLRNVALKTDFMHDGRFKTLEEVINFYDHQVHIGVSNIDPVMVKPGKEDGLNLNEQEKMQLLAFLKTLTDSVMINSPDFKAP